MMNYKGKNLNLLTHSHSLKSPFPVHPLIAVKKKFKNSKFLHSKKLSSINTPLLCLTHSLTHSLILPSPPLVPTYPLQPTMPRRHHLSAAAVGLSLLLLSITVDGWRPWRKNTTAAAADLEFGSSKKYEGSSEFVKLKYHMGPVLTANITVHVIWYGTWHPAQKHIIREFINSISHHSPAAPSVAGWWKTVQLYTDQTGSNISQTVRLGSEKNDRFYSHGKSLTRLSIQSVIRSAVTATTKPLPVSPKSGIYLLLTSPDVYVQDFCRQVIRNP